MQEIKKSGGVVFDNPVLDFLTQSNPPIVVGIFVPIISYLFYNHLVIKPELVPAIGLFAFGFLIWTLTEYVLHRFVFHFAEHSENIILKNFHYTIHGVHHKYPKDKTRLLFPPLASLFLCTLLFYAFKGIFPENFYAIYSGFILGYLTYDLIHYSIHNVNLKSKVMIEIRKHHNLHHYKTKDQGYGVSSPLWDIVFRTMPKVSK